MEDIELIELIETYIAQFTPYQKIAYQIALKQLETSFCIEKSIGFLKFKMEHKMEHKMEYKVKNEINSNSLKC